MDDMNNLIDDGRSFFFFSKAYHTKIRGFKKSASHPIKLILFTLIIIGYT